jgi:hypothetical protein
MVFVALALGTYATSVSNDVYYCDPSLERVGAGARCRSDAGWHCCKTGGQSCYRKGVRAEFGKDGGGNYHKWADTPGADAWCMSSMDPTWDQSTAYVEPGSAPKVDRPTTTTTTTKAPTTTTTTAAPTADSRTCLGSHENCHRSNSPHAIHGYAYSKRLCDNYNKAGYGCHWGTPMQWVPCEHTTCRIEHATRVGTVSTPSFIKVLHPGCPLTGCDSKDHHHNGGGLHKCVFKGKPTYKCECVCARRAVDGKFSAWSEWDTCTKSCGGGQQARSRTCSDPAPMFGGRNCEGSDAEKRECGKGPCPVNGGWSDWSTPGACSVTACGQTGTRRMTRTCSNPAKAHGGLDCVGSENDDSTACATAACPTTTTTTTTTTTPADCSASCVGKTRVGGQDDGQPACTANGCGGYQASNNFLALGHGGCTASVTAFQASNHGGCCDLSKCNPCAMVQCQAGWNLVGADERGCGGTCWFSTPDDLSTGQPCQASSETHGTTCALALNGDTRRDHPFQLHTAKGDQWVRVLLKASTTNPKVTFYARNCCSSNTGPTMRMFIGATDNLSAATDCGKITGIADSTTNVATCTGTGKFVWLRTDGAKTLQVPEFKVEGVPAMLIA